MRERQRQRRPRHPGASASPGISLALLHDPVVRAFLAAIVLSVIGLWVLVTLREDSLSEAVALRIGADGEPSVWGTSQAMLRLPFVASVLAVLSVGTAILVSRYDAFASRFTLGTGFIAQVLAWVAAFALLW